TGVVSIANQSFTVSQGGAACTFTIAPTTSSHGAAADTGVVSVTTISGCSWTVTNTNNWLTIVSATNNTNSGNVTYTVAANPSSIDRTGLVTIAGHVLTVNQAGAACTYSLSPASRSHSASAETGTVAVTTITGCPWTAA